MQQGDSVLWLSPVAGVIKKQHNPELQLLAAAAGGMETPAA